MSAVDYDRTAALFFDTVDDTGDANVFGQNCLDLPGDKIGDLVVKDSVVALTDSISQFNFYRRSAFTGNALFLGARINTGSSNDGYYAGISNEFSPELVIFKRVSEVLTQLNLGENIVGLVIDTEFILQFAVKGTGLEIRLIRESDMVTIDSLFVSDLTFSNSGTVSIFKPFVDAVAERYRIDKHEISEIA